MIQIYKTLDEHSQELKLLDNIEEDCWINIVAPSDE